MSNKDLLGAADFVPADLLGELAPKMAQRGRGAIVNVSGMVFV